MMNDSSLIDPNEIDLIDIIQFVQQRGRQMILVASLLYVPVLIYGFSRPDLYQSKLTLEVGQSLWFSNPSDTQTGILVESPEQIRYRLSGEVEVSAVKNTRFVEVSAVKNTRFIELISTATTASQSEEKLNRALDQILTTHATIQAEKKALFREFLTLLNQTSPGPTSDDIQLFDAALSSRQTHSVGDVSTTELKYSGELTKTLVVGAVASLFFSFFFALIMAFLERLPALIKEKTDRSPP